MQLSPNTSIYQSSQAYVLRTADDRHFELTLSPDDVDELFEVLGNGALARSNTVDAALRALIDAGHVVGSEELPAVRIHGQGRIAAAVAAVLGHNRIRSTAMVCHISDDEPDSDAIRSADLACYRDGIWQVVTPASVRATDVIGRRQACTARRERLDASYLPTPGGRAIDSALHPVSDRAADRIAEIIVHEIITRGNESDRRTGYLLTSIDLRTMAVSRHPVLPIPVAPQ